MPKVFLKTYGCQMNERDSEQVLRDLSARGFERAASEVEADVILLNTCSVRDMAEQKAIGKMGLLARLRRNKPETVFGFLGCMAQSRGPELVRDMEHVDLVVGTQKFHKVAEHVELLYRRKLDLREKLLDDLRFSIVDVDEEAGSQETIRDHVLKERQAGAFVSIMQGCNMMCTYCIVPFTRGAERSRRIDEIVEEVRGLAEQGVKEVTLLGQIVNLYGRHDFESIGGKSPFVQLLAAVQAVDGVERIRFTSPHPIGFRSDLVRCFAEMPKLMPHVHLPVQSGSNRILKGMHRGYTREKYLDLIAQLRAARSDLAITTDVIVGFPGETDADYLATRELMTEADFDNAYVFRYSQRRDTPAAQMGEQTPEPVKEWRNQDLLSVVDDLARAKCQAAAGTIQEVLCEGVSKNNRERLVGRTRHNKTAVFAGDPARHTGCLVDLRIESALGFTLYGVETTNERRPMDLPADRATERSRLLTSSARPSLAGF